ncbi:MAG TPA: Ig-like domain-containing protein [Longimicrobiales bacterium]|nr:Ig-like domain-containing protein [Longimicrobiales bacterium]
MADQYRTPPRNVGRKALLTLSGALLWWASVACPSSTEPGAPDLLNPELDRLDVTPDSVELEVGQSRSISVQAFDENQNNVTATASFEWSSAHAQYVAVEASGQQVTVQGLQEWVDGGTTGWNQVTVRIRGRSAPVGRVYVKVLPVDNIQVTPSPLAIQVGESVSVTADATITSGASVSVPTTWSLGNGTVASVTAQTGSNTATVTGLAPGTTTLRATAGTKESGPVALTVTPSATTYARSVFATVPDAITIDFDAQGNLFVGNTGVTMGGNDVYAHVRKVTPQADTTRFGAAVADPDALLVDRQARVSTLGANALLVTGAYDSQYSNNHVTEIKADGSVTRALVESAPPLLSNPSALAFLPNGDLLVGNYGNSTVTRVRRTGNGALELVPFYADNSAANGLGSVVVLDQVVYVVTGSKKLTALDTAGAVIALDRWPSGGSAKPALLAVDGSGNFGDGLIVAASDGTLWRMDTSGSQLARVGDFTFTPPIYGVGISPADGALYVLEQSGTIWKVTKE